MTKTEASYRTAGGAIIDVLSHRDFPGDYKVYNWTCPGCRREKPLIADGHDAALSTAEEHAKTCTALPRKAAR